MPGSPERILLGRVPNVPPAVVQATREKWGLDKPLFPDQFVAYLFDLQRVPVPGWLAPQVRG